MSSTPVAPPVNVLLITLDDMDAGTPGIFGGPPGVTPRIDALAGEGMVFRRAHVAAAVCQPSRSAIMTGRWPHRNGAEGFEPIADGVPLLTTLLAEQGYRCGILGKLTHLTPIERFGWDTAIDMPELGIGRNPEIYGAQAREFFSGAEGRPWFLMANAHDPHRPFHGSIDEHQRWSAEHRATYPDPSGGLDVSDVALPASCPTCPGSGRNSGSTSRPRVARTTWSPPSWTPWTQAVRLAAPWSCSCPTTGWPSPSPRPTATCAAR